MRTWIATVREPAPAGVMFDPTVPPLSMLMPFERDLLDKVKGHRFIVRVDGPPFDPIPEFVAQMIAVSGMAAADPVDLYDFAHDFLDVDEQTPAGGAL